MKSKEREANKRRSREYRLKYPEKVRASKKAWNLANFEKLREKQLLRKYGMTRREYDALLYIQAGLCAICYEPMNPPVVDHDHRTGRVRGLLCHLCNRSIGLLKENVQVLRSAVSYLENGELHKEKMKLLC